MSLIVYPYRRNEQTGSLIDIEEQPNEPFNDIFGLEVWRLTIWGSACLGKLNCKLLNSLKHQDIYAENEEIEQLFNEIELIKNNISYVADELNVKIESLQFRLDNALDAIRIAKKYPNSGVCIG